MPLNKLDNFIKNTEGRILYVNPNDLDSTDSIENQGNSLARPFKTIQRALLEAARFSWVKGNNNDIVEKTTILLFPGEHIVDNRPGWAIYSDGNAKAVDRNSAPYPASDIFSLDLNSNFDLNQEDNILYKFNSWYGGVVVPRGTSIVGLDLRKTKIRPKYVPNPTDDTVNNSAIFRITGACYFWQFSIFDGDISSKVYTNPNSFTGIYESTPTFSHHKLTCFEFCDGVNEVILPIGGSTNTGLTDLDMYYSKVSNAFNTASGRDIDEKFPSSPDGFTSRNPEWEIVGAFAADPLEISSIISGDGGTATSVVTVTTTLDHGLNVGTPIKIKGVGDGTGLTQNYNISTTVQNVLSSKSFTYLLPSLDSYKEISARPSYSGATVTVETDTVSGASPYIFNCSLRSVWGMNGLHADGSKASGFRSTVVAQFTAVSLQKDDRAFAKYNPSSRTYEKIEKVEYQNSYGSTLADGASQKDKSLSYHLDPDAVYRQGWESSHIKVTNDAFIQIVSVFAIGFNKHFDAQTGGDASITNSNSNFGQISLSSSGFKKEAFAKDNKAFITSIIPPRAITGTEEQVDWVSLDVGLTTSVGALTHLYLYGYNSVDNPPTAITQGYRVGARVNDKLYFVGAGVTYSASIYMCNEEISKTVFTNATGTFSSFKSYSASAPSASFSFTIGTNNLVTGEKVKIISDNGDLPENIVAHQTYYVIKDGSTAVKLASSYTNAIQGQPISVYKGTNLTIISRVSDKEAGDIGSPIQFDAANKNWFIHVNTGNTIYSELLSGGVAKYGETTDVAFIKRISDERSLDEKLYKFRVVIPRELSNAKDPEAGFILQESSSTGVARSTDFTRTSIGRTDYDYNKNPRFISTCTVSSNTVTVITELPHNMQVGETVIVKNVKSTTNSTGQFNSGYNGRFVVTGITNANTFTYSTIDVNGVTHSPGNCTSNTSTRDENLPRFERNDWGGNLFIYRNEVISPYIQGKQDGIYHLYVLNANNQIEEQFTNLKFGQLPSDLYPQLDRDNVDDNPRASKTYAKRAPIGEVVTNDLKKSITRESADLVLKEVGIGLTVASVSSPQNPTATLTFSRFHGLSGIVTGAVLSGDGGSGYLPAVGSKTYYNIQLRNDAYNGSWNGATAKVIVSGGSVNYAEIMAPGSGYSIGGSLYFDNSVIGGNGDAVYTIAGVSTNIGDVVQVTGTGTTSDGYYRISSVPSSTTVSIAKTATDPTIISGQYIFVVGPSVQITSSAPAYNSTTGTTTFVTTTAHGLLSGNKFRVIDSSNNNLGDYVVKDRVSVTSFTAITNKSLSTSASGYILKHGLSANEGVSGVGGESLGSRGVSFYDNEVFKLTSDIAISTPTVPLTHNSGIGTAQRLPLGSYIQIDNEIMRVVSSNNTIQATVERGVFGSPSEEHSANSLIRKINPVAIEFRRPSIVRASGHTFEYLGYGPGNYSTGLPQVQVKTLSEAEQFFSQAQERSAGVVVYTGMNNNGDFFNGNTKTIASSGEVVSYDIPTPTVTGENTKKLSVVFDEVTIKDRLLVEGGTSGTILSQFDGPVTFNKELKLKGAFTTNNTIKITNSTQSTSTTTGALVVTGGVAIGSRLNVGGNVDIDGTLNVDGASTFQSSVTFNSSIVVDSNLRFNDNDHLYLGTGNDLDIYHDGSNTYIKDAGTGNLIIQSNLLNIQNAAGSETLATFTENGAVSLYYDNSLKLATKSTGIDITGQLDVTGDITAFYTSDQRLKDNVTPIPRALDKVLSLSGNTFDWNDKSGKEGTEVGVIAQEVQAVLPEVVVERDNGYLAVQYDKLVPLLIEAIKDLKAEINELKGLN